MITDLYMYGLFVVAAVSVYSLIYSRQNRFLTAIMIPLILIVSIWTWQAIKILQGTPKTDLPWEKQVEVVWAYQDKPSIYLVAKIEGDRLPVYYVIPWTDENMYKVRKMQLAIQKKGSAEGKFKKPKGYTGAQSSFFFEEVKRFQDRTNKNGDFDYRHGGLDAQ